ncbi:dihydrodipicolinate synthase family protein [Mucilaginibacter sp.]|uniref:dihydrodipicolinate synthase family protein n=1 Tax=Mucilaginibacter sp. TaxID=1882438 RepID=UPI003D1524C7
MKFEHLQGLIAAPFTPMDNNGGINTTIIPAYYKFLKQNGNTGAFICGSTGEGVSLTIEEKKHITDVWAKCTVSDKDFKVMLLVGGNTLADCIELAKHAQKAGIYAVSFTSPSYFKPANVAVLAQMCRQIAAAVPGIPFYYYHIPVLTNVGFPMIDLLNAVNDVPNFAGIKYTHEDFMDFLSCSTFQNGQYDMLWGRDENMLPALAVGAKGAVGSTFNYAAPLYYDLINAFENNDLEKAQQLQQKSVDMIRLLGKYGGISVGKAYMKLVGIDCGEFRLPVSNMTQEQFENFKLDVSKLGFDEFKSNLQPQVSIK